MPPVGFEPTISVLERAKTVRALDRLDVTRYRIQHISYVYCQYVTTYKNKYVSHVRDG
jgi:hypothetical protein